MVSQRILQTHRAPTVLNQTPQTLTVSLRPVRNAIRLTSDMVVSRRTQETFRNTLLLSLRYGSFKLSPSTKDSCQLLMPSELQTTLTWTDAMQIPTHWNLLSLLQCTKLTLANVDTPMLLKAACKPTYSLRFHVEPREALG